MIELQDQVLTEISAGFSSFPLPDYNTLKDYSQYIPAAVTYGLAAKSLLAGGPFAAPAQIWLLYNVLYYNNQRVPLGTTLDDNSQVISQAA